MTRVEVRDGKFEGAYKKFKQKFAKSGVPSELKERKYYEKPGKKRKKAVKEAKKNNKAHNKDSRDW